MNLHTVTLLGEHVSLSPLSIGHLDGLCDAGLDPEGWKLAMTVIRNRDDMNAYIETAQLSQKRNTALPFVIIEKKSGKTVGSTRYVNIDQDNFRLESGSTWIAHPWQCTAIDTEAKHLPLQHAFERLGCRRVGFNTDSINERSRNAHRRIGAREEGTLRKHMRAPSGHVRHSVYYSADAGEWPAVKQSLKARLPRHGNESTPQYTISLLSIT